VKIHAETSGTRTQTIFHKLNDKYWWS